MPVNTVENRLLLYSVDGDNYSPISLSLYDISIDDVVETETDDSRSIKYLQNPVFMTITLPHKNISRKKFKKWLMHLPQHDRNFAERWCYVIGVLKGRVSYAESYLYMSLDPSGLSLLNFITNKLEETEK